MRHEIRKVCWPKGLFAEGKVFRFKRMVEGRKAFQTIGEISEREAIVRAHELNALLKSGRPVERRKRQNPTLRAFLQGAIKAKAGGLSPKSVRRYNAVVDNFLSWLGNRREMLLRDTDQRTIAEYLAWRQESAPDKKRYVRRLGTACKATIYFEFAFLKGAFAEAVDRKLLDANPCWRLKCKKPKKSELAGRHHPLTLDEAGKVILAAREIDPGFGDVVELAILTGLRLGELTVLEWADVDFSNRLLRLCPKRVTEKRNGKVM